MKNIYLSNMSDLEEIFDLKPNDFIVNKSDYSKFGFVSDVYTSDGIVNVFWKFHFHMEQFKGSKLYDFGELQRYYLKVKRENVKKKGGYFYIKESIPKSCLMYGGIAFDENSFPFTNLFLKSKFSLENDTIKNKEVRHKIEELKQKDIKFDTYLIHKIRVITKVVGDARQFALSRHNIGVHHNIDKIVIKKK